MSVCINVSVVKSPPHWSLNLIWMACGNSRILGGYNCFWYFKLLINTGMSAVCIELSAVFLSMVAPALETSSKTHKTRQRLCRNLCPFCIIKMDVVIGKVHPYTY